MEKEFDVKRLKETYVQGMRIRLLKMDDIQAPSPGMEGTIIGVDDIGTIMVTWDSGSSLSLVFGTDEFEIVK